MKIKKYVMKKPLFQISIRFLIMVSTYIKDELELLESAYSNEIDFIWNGFTQTLQCTIKNCKKQQELKFDCFFPTSYPNHPPNITVKKSVLEPFQINQLDKQIISLTSSLINQPMMFEVVQLLIDFVENFEESTTPMTTCSYLLNIDHMRNRTRYLKYLKQWSNEENLSVSVIFFFKYIFVLLNGLEDNCENFIKLIRSKHGIDVDAKGNPCKEKMMKIICKISNNSQPVVRGFSTKDINSQHDLKIYFVELKCEEIYHNHIVKLLH